MLDRLAYWGSETETASIVSPHSSKEMRSVQFSMFAPSVAYAILISDINTNEKTTIINPFLLIFPPPLHRLIMVNTLNK